MLIRLFAPYPTTIIGNPLNWLRFTAGQPDAYGIR